ncbi:MAG: hypothetical protein QM488_02980 [Rhizobiaceae bacterium]
MNEKTYSEYMSSKKPYLTFTLNLKEPVEIEEFARFFSGFGSLFDDYLRTEHKEIQGEAKLYVKEVRKGSIAADLILHIPDLIGYMDDVLIVGGFASLFSKRVREYIHGKWLKGASKSQLKHVTDAITAIANDPNGSATLEAVAFEENGEHRKLAIRFTSKEARSALKTIEEQKASLDKSEHADHEKVLMLFERPAKTVVGSGKKTKEAGVISSIYEKPLPIIYESEMAEREIKQHFQSENVFQHGFVVDVNVEKRNGRMLAYKIIGLHQIIDLPDDD